LNMLAGFVTPTGGRVAVDGERVFQPGPDRGVVFQEVGLFPWLTVQDNVEFGLKMSKATKKERASKAKEVLSLTGMNLYASRYPNELSGGMKQRVGLARVLANDPKVLLMDEPFGALDAQTRRLMQDELLKLWEATRKTVVFITHSVDEALYLADRVVVMTGSPGRIKADLRIDLPRPRDENGVEFNEMERDIKAMIMADTR
jgi:NitT/TauT family transport system ATP-binding protein